MLWDFQVLPPLAVPRATPSPIADSPTASQIAEDAQAMPDKEETPPGMLSDFHVAPPLVVPMTTPVPVARFPTASQVAEDAQAIPNRASTPPGTLRRFQVVPPFVVPMTTPAVALWPTASQMVADLQEMPLTEVIPFGIRWGFQAVPPLVVPMTTPVCPGLWPTASQAVANGHAMLLTAEIPFGIRWDFQVVPPLVVPRTRPTPVPPLLLPTASQVVDDLQAMPLRTRATAGYDVLTLQVSDLAPATAGDGANPPRRTRADSEKRTHVSRAVRDLDRCKSETPPSIPPPRYPGSIGTSLAFLSPRMRVGSLGWRFVNDDRSLPEQLNQITPMMSASGQGTDPHDTDVRLPSS